LSHTRVTIVVFRPLDALAGSIQGPGQFLPFASGVTPVLTKPALHTLDLVLVLAQSPELPARKVTIGQAVADPRALPVLAAIDSVFETAVLCVTWARSAPMVPIVPPRLLDAPAGSVARPVPLAAFHTFDPVLILA
jgi:hypothetical protein